MKVKVLASGSKGNSTYIESNGYRLLIDIGISFSYLCNQLEKINVEPKELNAILITHAHGDHTKGLQSLIKRNNIPVYVTEKMVPDIEEFIPQSTIRILAPKNEIGPFQVECIPTSHDVESTGYLINDERVSLVYITDTGYINRKYLKLLVNKEMYIMESNHDEKMLMDGPYPFILKQRIIGDKGHLSNTIAAHYLNEIVGEKTKYIVLAHLSEHNNTEELAYETTKNLLIENHHEQPVYVAKQRESLDLLEV